MFYRGCIIAILITWGLIGTLVVAVLYAPHWVVALIGVAVALVLLRPNVGGRRH